MTIAPLCVVGVLGMIVLAGCSAPASESRGGAGATSTDGDRAGAGGGGAGQASAGSGGSAGGASGSAGTAGSTGGAMAGGGPSGGGGTAGTVADPDCVAAPGEVAAEVTAVAVANTEGAAPVKGDALAITLTIENSGPGVGVATITPLIDSQRFGDYSAVPLGSSQVTLCKGTTEVTLTGGPFLSKEAEGKHYALGSGDYSVSAVVVAVQGQPQHHDAEFTGAAFSVATSGALFVPVVYDAGYLAAVTGHDATTVEEFLTDSFTRSNQIFTPSGDDPDGAGDYQSFPGASTR